MERVLAEKYGLTHTCVGVTFRSSTVMKVTSNSLGLNLGTLLSVPRVYEF